MLKKDRLFLFENFDNYLYLLCGSNGLPSRCENLSNVPNSKLFFVYIQNQRLLLKVNLCWFWNTSNNNFFFNKHFHHNFQDTSQVRLFQCLSKKFFLDGFSIFLSSCFLPYKDNRKNHSFFKRFHTSYIQVFQHLWTKLTSSSCVFSHEFSSKLCWWTVFCVDLFYYIKLYNYCKLIYCNRKKLFEKHLSKWVEWTMVGLNLRGQ